MSQTCREFSIADRRTQTAYQLNGVILLPHYFLSGAFVCPGYPRQKGRIYDEDKLIALGAASLKIPLWPRRTVTSGRLVRSFEDL